MSSVLFTIPLLLIFICPSFGEEIVDPFVNPYKKIIELDKNPTKKKKNIEKVFEKFNLFKTELNINPEEVFLEGVVRINGTYRAILRDWKGRVYTVFEGEAISPDTKVFKIRFNKVILVKYSKLNGKLKRKFLVLKLEEEK